MTTIDKLVLLTKDLQKVHFKNSAALLEISGRFTSLIPELSVIKNDWSYDYAIQVVAGELQDAQDRQRSGSEYAYELALRTVQRQLACITTTFARSGAAQQTILRASILN